MELAQHAVRCAWSSASAVFARFSSYPQKLGCDACPLTCHDAGAPTDEQAEAGAEAGEEDEEDDDDVAVDNGDSAVLLLRALAAQEPAVNDKLKGSGGLLQARSCTIM